MTVEVEALVDQSATTIAGASHQMPAGQKTFQASVAGTGAVSATVLLKVRNRETAPWLTVATFTLSGTTSAADGLVTDAPWKYWSGEVTAVSGTGAAVSLDAGYAP